MTELSTEIANTATAAASPYSHRDPETFARWGYSRARTERRMDDISGTNSARAPEESQ